jgi:hypothetical protein
VFAVSFGDAVVEWLPATAVSFVSAPVRRFGAKVLVDVTGNEIMHQTQPLPQNSQRQRPQPLWSLASLQPWLLPLMA